MHKTLHSGHRERLRNKALEYGMECLEDHEVVELFLGYSIPRKNTNEIAHRLVDAAGSLGGIFDMEISEVKKIEGMSEYSTFLVRLVKYMVRSKKKPPKRNVDLSRFSYVEKYADSLFAASENEVLYALLLDKKMRLIRAYKAAEGNEWQAGVSKKDILKAAIEESAASVILLHNHPGGVAYPSHDDLIFTVDMERACGIVDLCLVEHIVYAEGECHPIMIRDKMGSLKAIEYDRIVGNINIGEE